MNTYLYGCYTVQLAILFLVARTSSLPTIPLYPFHHHPILSSLFWIECTIGRHCLYALRWYESNRCSADSHFGIRELLQTADSLYNNNDMSVPACAAFYSRATPIRRCPPLWASKNIHEYQIPSSNLKREILPAARRLQTSHQIRAIRARGNRISLLIDWMTLSLAGSEFHQVSIE